MAHKKRDKVSRNKGVSGAGRRFAYTIAVFLLFIILLVIGSTVGLNGTKSDYHGSDHRPSTSDYDYRSDQ